MKVEHIVLRAALEFATHGIWVTLFLAYGFLFKDRRAFGKAFYIVMFTMIYNTYLKALWLIPLPQALQSSGWAFPSGHMHVAVVLWGGLAYDWGKPYFYLFVSLLWLVCGCALVIFGYHYPLDVLGAILFGLCSLWVYNLLLSVSQIQQHIPLVGIILAVLALPLALFIPPESKQGHVWLSLGGLLGFALGWMWSNKNGLNLPSSYGEHAVTLLILVLGLGGIELAAAAMPVLQATKIFYFTRFFLMAFWISGATRVLGNRLAQYLMKGQKP